MLRNILLATALAIACCAAMAGFGHMPHPQGANDADEVKYRNAVRTVSSIAENPRWLAAVEELNKDPKVLETFKNKTVWIDWLRKRKLPTPPRFVSIVPIELDEDDLQASWDASLDPNGLKRKIKIVITYDSGSGWDINIKIGKK